MDQISVNELLNPVYNRLRTRPTAGCHGNPNIGYKSRPGRRRAESQHCDLQATQRAVIYMLPSWVCRSAFRDVSMSLIQLR